MLQLTTEVCPKQAGHMARKVAPRARPVTKKTAKKAKAPATKAAKRPAPKKAALKKAGVAKKTVASKKAAVPEKMAAPKVVRAKAKPKAELDWSGFPRESLVESTLGLCLACALNVLTRHLGLAPERAHAEIRRYNPTLEELTTPSPSRPYLAWPAEECPYCQAPAKWHAPLKIARIEGGKATDSARRALVKAIGENPSFLVVEEKSTERDALYSWLSKTGAGLDLDSPGWQIEAAGHWLSRRLPGEDWKEILQNVRAVRRSRRLEEGFEKEDSRLFLAPALYDEILLIQYLLSRSHKAGGQTFEGRLTLNEMFHRLRRGGYMNRMGIATNNPGDALEQLVEMLGGEGRVKFYYIVDRRDFLAQLAGLKDARVPRPKAS